MSDYSIDNIAAAITEDQINVKPLLEDEETAEDTEDDGYRPTIPEDHTKVTRKDLMGGTTYFDYKNHCLFYHFNEVHYLSRIFDGVIKISIDPAKASARANDFTYGYLARRGKDGVNFHLDNYFSPPSNFSRRGHINFIDSITLFDVISVPRKGYDRWNPYKLSNGRPTDLSQEEMIDELVPNMSNTLAVAVHDFLSYYFDLLYFNATKNRIKEGRDYNFIRDPAGWTEDAFTIRPCMFTDTIGYYDMEYEFEGLAVGQNTYNGLANFTLNIRINDEGVMPHDIQLVGFEYLDKHDQRSDTFVEVKEIDTFELYRIFARIRYSHRDNADEDFEDYCDNWANDNYEGKEDSSHYDESDYDHMD